MKDFIISFLIPLAFRLGRYGLTQIYTIFQ